MYFFWRCLKAKKNVAVRVQLSIFAEWLKIIKWQIFDQMLLEGNKTCVVYM